MRYRLDNHPKAIQSKGRTMACKIKSLGLSLVAVFAIGAVSASVASAQNGIFTSDGPATLIGTQTGVANENSITAFSKTVTCPNATYTGHKVNVTPHEPIPSGATQATLTPHYGVCASNTGAFPTTIDMNGCDYVISIGETTGIADQYFLSTQITCPTGQHIVITLFTTASGHTANTPFCNLTLTENPAGYTGLKQTDTTNSTLDVTGTIEGLVLDKKSNAADTGILCPTEETKTGILHFDISAVDKNGTRIGNSHN
jgi:hypothetical protein